MTDVDTLCADLLNWRTLYLAGRMHKPLRIIKDDARVRLTQQVNLASALRTALLMLPEAFTPRELFARIASISYAGDPRMLLPAENRAKIGNIVTRQEDQFRELYWRLAYGLPGVRWPGDAGVVEQDTSPHARAAHLKKLPQGLLCRVHERMEGRGPAREADESAYWLRIAGDETLPTILHEGMRNHCLPRLVRADAWSTRNVQDRAIPRNSAVSQGHRKRRGSQEHEIHCSQSGQVVERQWRARVIILAIALDCLAYHGFILLYDSDINVEDTII